MVDGKDAEVVEEGVETAKTASGARKGNRSPVVSGIDAEVFGDIEIKLSAILGEGSLSVRQLLGLEEGSVVDLGTPLDGKIDLTLNDRLIAQGEIVAVGDKFGVRISKIIAEKK